LVCHLCKHPPLLYDVFKSSAVVDLTLIDGFLANYQFYYSAKNGQPAILAAKSTAGCICGSIFDFYKT